MGNYLKLDSTGTIVENLLISDADLATEWGLVEAPAGVGPGWTLVSGTWTAPAPPAPLPGPLADVSLPSSPTLSEVASVVAAILAYIQSTT